jgi:hypothetical protein
MHSDMIGHLGPVLSSPAGSHTLPLEPNGTGTARQWRRRQTPSARRALLLGHSDVDMPWADGGSAPAVSPFPGGAPARAHARRLFRPRTDAAFPGRSLVFFSPPLPFSVDELMRRVRLGENGWGRQQLGWLSLALSDRRRRACIFRGGRLPPSLVSAQVADPQPQACARPAHPLPVRESTPAAAATFARPPCTSSLLPWSTRLPPRSLAGARLPRAVPRR